jgi:hypothetical protein
LTDGANDHHDFIARRIAGGLAELFQIQTVENLAMQVGLNLLGVGPLEGLKICHKTSLFGREPQGLKPHSMPLVWRHDLSRALPVCAPLHGYGWTESNLN